MCKLQKELADLEIQIQNLKNQQVDLAIAVAGKEQIHKLIQSAISEIGSERIRNLFLSELRDLGIIAEPEQPSDDDTEEEIEQHEELLGRMCDYLEGKIEPLDSDDEEDDDGWEEFQAFTPDEEIINENEISATAENEFVKIRSRVTGDEFTVPILRSNEIWIWTENPKPDGLFDEELKFLQSNGAELKYRYDLVREVEVKLPPPGAVISDAEIYEAALHGMEKLRELAPPPPSEPDLGEFIESLEVEMPPLDDPRITKIQNYLKGKRKNNPVVRLARELRNANFPETDPEKSPIIHYMDSEDLDKLIQAIDKAEAPKDDDFSDWVQIHERLGYLKKKSDGELLALYLWFPPGVRSAPEAYLGKIEVLGFKGSIRKQERIIQPEGGLEIKVGKPTKKLIDEVSQWDLSKIPFQKPEPETVDFPSDFFGDPREDLHQPEVTKVLTLEERVAKQLRQKIYNSLPDIGIQNREIFSDNWGGVEAIEKMNFQELNLVADWLESLKSAV